jgi:hypothetical protein
MGEKEFLAKLGFTANPFQFTNADEEDHLQSYFVPPPYFDSVWGDPSKPVTHVIFAPRGGGKSEFDLWRRKDPKTESSSAEAQIKHGAAWMIFQVASNIFQKEFANRHGGSLAQVGRRRPLRLVQLLNCLA